VIFSPEYFENRIISRNQGLKFAKKDNNHLITLILPKHKATNSGLIWRDFFDALNQVYLALIQDYLTGLVKD